MYIVCGISFPTLSRQIFSSEGLDEKVALCIGNVYKTSLIIKEIPVINFHQVLL